MRLRKEEGTTKAAAILALHEKEPHLDSLFLAERFNCTQSHVCNVLAKAKRGQEIPSEDTLFRCRRCQRIFKSEESLDDHLETCRGKIPCPHCGRMLLPPGLGAHLRRRKETGICPVPQGCGRKRSGPLKQPKKSKLKIPRRRATAEQRRSVEDWT